MKLKDLPLVDHSQPGYARLYLTPLPESNWPVWQEESGEWYTMTFSTRPDDCGNAVLAKEWCPRLPGYSLGDGCYLVKNRTDFVGS